MRATRSAEEGCWLARRLLMLQRSISALTRAPGGLCLRLV
jgi:hypothetical protein